LTNADIGIDAQVEVLDSNQKSTGRFVGFQVKARSIPDENNARYVTEQQLMYWKSSDVPVFVALVHLHSGKIYLHQVCKNSQYPPTTKTGLVRIEFDLVKDVFSAASRILIAEAGIQEILAKLEELLRPLNDESKRIEEAIRENISDVNFWKKRAYLSEFFQENLTKAKAIVMANEVGNDALEAARSQFLQQQHALYKYLVENDVFDGQPKDARIDEFMSSFDY
jgi:ElaB/YqjD/DUF883 family membrane-anchored ribosome-binding protein